MSKKNLERRSQLKGHIGKTTGRSRGPLVYNDVVGIKVTQKIDEAIKKNRDRKSN